MADEFEPGGLDAVPLKAAEAAAALEALKEPAEKAAGAIEDAFGRQRSMRNAPRTLDLDLIAYGRVSGDLDGLILPHPRAAERRFVMGPIAEIAPKWRHPTARGSAAELRDAATVCRDAHPLA